MEKAIASPFLIWPKRLLEKVKIENSLKIEPVDVFL